MMVQDLWMSDKIEEMFNEKKNRYALQQIVASNPSSLALRDVTYCVQRRIGPWWKGLCCRSKQPKKVLRNINLHFGEELTAILGSSGAGKSSLLDILSLRVDGKVTGSVVLNGQKCTESNTRGNIAYVIQYDRLLPNLTVRETLTYAAYLRMPGDSTHQQVEEKVDKIIHQMGLSTVADTKIGGTIVRGISGGEKRRVTIGVQLLQDAKVLLLDEPTTGLDSCTAKSLMSRLRTIAESGTSVLVTIHQPGSGLFQLFHKICLLSNGVLAFAGTPSEMLDFYTNAGFPCPKFSNPLDFYVDLVSVDRRDMKREQKSEDVLKELMNQFLSSPEHATLNKKVYADNTNDDDWQQSSVRSPTPFRILTTLLKRMTVNVFRDRSSYCTRLFVLSLFIPFICTFLGKLRVDQSSIQDRVGLMYQTLMVPPYVSAFNTAFLFPSLRDVYFREYKDGLYSPLTFITAYMMHAIPFHFVASIFFSSIIYWVTGLTPTPDKFIIFLCLVFFLHVVGEILTVGAMTVFMNGQMAVNIVTLILTASLLFGSGLLRSIDTMIDPLRWLGWLTIHKYATEILVVNEFQGLQLICEDTDKCQFQTGDDYLTMFFPNAVNNLGRNVGVLVGYLLIVIIFTIIVLKIRGVPNVH
ncbi:ATP-binding cassette sub-family G member 5-like [Ylistrum balloti]|uniref:ATP-binding cassette sub-family G member 5-like n=1 Tax=Ylistrum balloti TaxID=509963 RepID=UPI0029059568|nr:ATP-binding cassette sub-family G member 5-like [Ylistrum balloti]